MRFEVLFMKIGVLVRNFLNLSKFLILEIQVNKEQYEILQDANWDAPIIFQELITK